MCLACRLARHYLCMQLHAMFYSAYISGVCIRTHEFETVVADTRICLNTTRARPKLRADDDDDGDDACGACGACVACVYA